MSNTVMSQRHAESTTTNQEDQEDREDREDQRDRVADVNEYEAALFCVREVIYRELGELALRDPSLVRRVLLDASTDFEDHQADPEEDTPPQVTLTARLPQGT